MQRIKDPKIKTLDKKEHLNIHTRKKSINQSRTERKVLTLVENREREKIPARERRPNEVVISKPVIKNRNQRLPLSVLVINRVLVCLLSLFHFGTSTLLLLLLIFFGLGFSASLLWHMRSSSSSFHFKEKTTFFLSSSMSVRAKTLRGGRVCRCPVYLV